MFLFVRLGVVLPVLAGSFFLSFTKIFKKIWQEVFVICFIVSSSGLIFLLANIPHSIFYYGGLFLVYMAGYFFIKFRFLAASITGLVIIIIFNVFLFTIGIDNIKEDNYILLANSFYFATNVIGIVALYNIERLERLDFHKSELLSWQQNEIEKINANLEKQVKDRTAKLNQQNIELEKEIEGKKQIQEKLIVEKHRTEVNEDRLRLSLKASNQGMYDLNIKTGQTITNDQFAVMLGYKPQEFSITFEDWKEWLHPDDKEKTLKALDEYLSKKSNEYIVKFRFRTKDNKWRWILSHGQIFSYTKEGEPLRMIGIHSDITKQKELETELISAKEKAEESDRLKSEFMDNMSHEVRTPLNAIMGFTKFIAKEGISKQKRETYAKTILDSSKQLLRTIEDILEITRLSTKLEQVNIRRANLNQILSDLYIDFEEIAQKKNISIKLIKDKIDDDCYVATDAIKLHKILHNLIENALKFTKEGEITVGYTIENVKCNFKNKNARKGDINFEKS